MAWSLESTGTTASSHRDSSVEADKVARSVMRLKLKTEEKELPQMSIDLPSITAT